MTPQQKQERREKIMKRLLHDMELDFIKIQIHLNKQAEWPIKGFLGYKK